MPFDNNTKPAPRFAMVLKDHGAVSSFPHAVVMVDLYGMQAEKVSALFPTADAASHYASLLNEGLLEDSLGTGLDMAKSMIKLLLMALPSLLSQLKPRGDVGGTGDTQQPADGHKDANPQPAEPTADKPPFLTIRKNKTDGGYDVFGMGLNGWKDDTAVANYTYQDEAEQFCDERNPDNGGDIVTLRKARGGDTYAAYRMDTDGWKGDWLRDFGTDKAAAEAYATEHNRAALGMGQTAAETA